MTKALSIVPILTLVAVTSCLAQKVIVDPNPTRVETSAAPAAAERYDPARDPDKRMAQKVSYEALHARLSAVTDALTQASKVSILCGKGKSDWPVRDIPVSMCAKEVPLGVLLRAIARATHNVVKAEKLNDAIVYRICQDRKLARQFLDYEKAKQEYRQALLSWQWDSAIAFRDVPDSEIKYYSPDPSERVAYITSMKKLSELLTCLGSDYRQRAMSGEAVTLDPSTVPSQIKAPLLDTLWALDKRRQSMAHHMSSMLSQPYVPPPQTPSDELAKTTLTIHVFDDSLQAVPGSPVGCALGLSPSCCCKFLHPDKVKMPASPAPPRIVEDSPYDLEFPDLANKPVPEFKVKVDLDDLAPSEELNYAAVMVEMAKRAGFSLVMEDWDGFQIHDDSHKQWLRKGVQLDEMRRFGFGLQVDMRDKMVVPLASDWTNEHQALVPASVIDALTKKMNADGVDLVDILPVLCLTPAQWEKWVVEEKDLGLLGCHSKRAGDPLWQFFAALTPEERAAAASKDGLSLRGFGPAVVTDLLTQCGKYRNMQHASSDKPSYPSIPDEEGLAQLTLRLTSSPGVAEWTYAGRFYGRFHATIPKDKVAPRGLDKTYDYSLAITGTVGSARQEYAEFSGPWNLPFYSKDREAELVKALMEDPKSNPSKTVQKNGSSR